jgi:hypothetical protein
VLHSLLTRQKGHFYRNRLRNLPSIASSFVINFSLLVHCTKPSVVISLELPKYSTTMTRSTIPANGVSATDSTSHLPRILCLHGGGTNARIFRAQCHIIRRHLENSFRLVFSDAPYISKPGPDVTSVYADWGPFRSWMKPQPAPRTIHSPRHLIAPRMC